MKYNYNEMLADIQAVLFDFDGTLVDSMWMWRSIDEEYLGSLGIELPEDLQHSIEGMSFSETAEYFKQRFQIKDSLETIKETWNRLAYKKYTSEVPMKPGAVEFLKHLKSDGKKLGIATSNSRELVDSATKALGIQELFDTIVTACEAGAGKPAPDIYLLAAENVKVKPEHCLVFEDIPMGIKAGLGAGMKVCAVEDLYSANIRKEKETLSHYFVEDYWDIEILK